MTGRFLPPLAMACIALTSCAPEHGGDTSAGSKARADRAFAACPTAGLSEAMLVQGRPIEETPAGTCVVKAADAGSTQAALFLGDFYRAATTHPNRAWDRIDTFGRETHWYREAARRGSERGQYLVASEGDRHPYMPLHDNLLDWYIQAARQGNDQAALAIARAYKLGRIKPAELHDFRTWLARNARPGTVQANVAATLEEDHAPIIN
ncbi:sel1 repeat family protein [Novosphingobium sp. NBM11]|uniref:sel1 repeat family protein n=1 Tax=Novosphingobium sp. NBM11 TaxID=2596914 RepID=UPI00189224BA|nr:sel1 repeat family protein [Novosphingobium sp. NBM11]